MQIKEKYQATGSWLIGAAFVPLFLIRVAIAWEFLKPAIVKWNDIHGFGVWMESLSIPLPYFSAWLTVYAGMLGIVLLVLGLGTRFISIALVMILLIVIGMAYWANGFEAAEQGMELRLLQVLMLLVLIVFGPGRMSLDHAISMNREKKLPLARKETGLYESSGGEDLYCRSYEDF